ncbi:hypothetical protein GJ496_009541 [Pomphorhynchus laevis]|nr:hypothetical protein GJ496_009541 [Pomphorhynchus laevis]
MSLSLSSSTYNRQNWEDSDFPVLCETCLGENPYIRMIKDRYGAKMRYKKTEICQTCSRLKNVCQTCLLDLEYGLPVEVRDTALKISKEIPHTPVNREYYMQNVERELEAAGPGGQLKLHGELGKAIPPSEMLLKLARTSPYYKRNRPHICSFWVKGECKRGEECPYRHEKPSDPDDPLSNQNIRDRYYGTDDPVAEKLLKRYNEIPKLAPPEDRSINTLYVGNLPDDISEKDLRDQMYSFGEIQDIVMVPKQNCGFVSFTIRESAERAAQTLYNRMVIRGFKAVIRWGRPKSMESTQRSYTSLDTNIEPFDPLEPMYIPPTQWL